MRGGQSWDPHYAALQSPQPDHERVGKRKILFTGNGGETLTSVSVLLSQFNMFDPAPVPACHDPNTLFYCFILPDIF